MKKIAITVFMITTLTLALLYDPASPINSSIDQALSHDLVNGYWLDEEVKRVTIEFNNFPHTDMNCHTAGEIIARVCAEGYTVRLVGPSQPSKVNPINAEAARWLAEIDRQMQSETADK